jgi:ribose/xylose/arabinose/galactoside ABC-type transport system permease subunit
VRTFYVALAPELEQYLLFPRAPPADGRRLEPSGWQLSLTTAGMVAVVNSLVIGASAGLVLAALGDGPLAVTLGVGAFVAVLALAVHRGHHRRALDAYDPEAIDRFATEERSWTD